MRMTVDESRNEQPAGAVDRLIAVQPDPDVGNPTVGKHNIRSTHLARLNVENRTGWRRRRVIPASSQPTGPARWAAAAQSRAGVPLGEEAEGCQGVSACGGDELGDGYGFVCAVGLGGD